MELINFFKFKIYGYIILSSASSILSFYLLITASIPVSKYAGESNNLVNILENKNKV